MVVLYTHHSDAKFQMTQERNNLKMEELKKKNSFKTLVAGNLYQLLGSQSCCC